MLLLHQQKLTTSPTAPTSTPTLVPSGMPSLHPSAGPTRTCTVSGEQINRCSVGRAIGVPIAVLVMGILYHFICSGGDGKDATYAECGQDEVQIDVEANELDAAISSFDVPVVADGVESDMTDMNENAVVATAPNLELAL